MEKLGGKVYFETKIDSGFRTNWWKKTADTLLGLDAINKRNKGLLHFVQLYKNLTRIPEPNPEQISVKDLFANIQILMKSSFAKEGIQFITNIHIEEESSIFADEKLISQVLINLISNSIKALSGSKKGIIQLQFKGGLSKV